jgi:pimeloyl-ACP methyl ester carboxylesterase
MRNIRTIINRLFITLLLISTTLVHAANETPVSYDKRLSNYSYPFNVKYFSFESQSQPLSMAYMYLPAQNNMPVITLLHGKNFTAAYWQQTANALHQLGYGVLMPDQIGFGKSSKPIHYQYSFAALANNTQALLNRLNIKKTILLGHSMGGMLASRFALIYPNITKQLILLNPIGLENYLRYTEYKNVDFFYQNELKKHPQDIINYQIKNYYDGQWNDKYEALTLPFTGWINGPDWPQIAKVNALTYDMIFTQPVIDEFVDFSVPVTVILGTRDRTAPGRNWKKNGVDIELGRYDHFAASIKQANSAIKTIEMEGLGHLPHIEAFDRFLPILQSVLSDKK